MKMQKNANDLLIKNGLYVDIKIVLLRAQTINSLFKPGSPGRYNLFEITRQTQILLIEMKLKSGRTEKYEARKSYSTFDQFKFFHVSFLFFLKKGIPFFKFLSKLFDFLASNLKPFGSYVSTQVGNFKCPYHHYIKSAIQKTMWGLKYSNFVIYSLRSHIFGSQAIFKEILISDLATLLDEGNDYQYLEVNKLENLLQTLTIDL